MSDRRKSSSVNVKARARLFEQAPREAAEPPIRRGSSSSAGSSDGKKRHADAALKAGTVRQVLRQVEHGKESTALPENAPSVVESAVKQESADALKDTVPDLKSGESKSVEAKADLTTDLTAVEDAKDSGSGSSNGKKRRGESALKAGTVQKVLKQVFERTEAAVDSETFIEQKSSPELRKKSDGGITPLDGKSVGKNSESDGSQKESGQNRKKSREEKTGTVSQILQQVEKQLAPASDEIKIANEEENNSADSKNDSDKGFSADKKKRNVESAVLAGNVHQVLQQIEKQDRLGSRKSSVKYHSAQEAGSDAVSGQINPVEHLETNEESRSENQLTDEKNQALKLEGSDKKEKAAGLNDDKNANESNVKKPSHVKNYGITNKSTVLESGSAEHKNNENSGKSDVKKRKIKIKSKDSDKITTNQENETFRSEFDYQKEKSKNTNLESDLIGIKESDAKIECYESKNNSKSNSGEKQLENSLAVDDSKEQHTTAVSNVVINPSASLPRTQKNQSGPFEGKNESLTYSVKNAAVSEEKQQTLSPESKPKNTCLLSELTQPELVLKIARLLPEECTEESRSESRGTAAPTDADLLTTAVTEKSSSYGSKEKSPENFCPVASYQVETSARGKEVKSSFWQRLSDSGSSISSSASDAEVTTAGTGCLIPHSNGSSTSQWQLQSSHHPSALLNKLGLVLSRSSTSSPEPYVNEDEFAVENPCFGLENTCAAKKENERTDQIIPNKQVEYKTNSLRTNSAHEKLFSFREEHDSNFVHPSLKNSHLPAGFDQTIFSFSSSPVDKWKFKPDESHDVGYNSDYKQKHGNEVNPTLQELLTSVQRIQDEFGKSNFDIPCQFSADEYNEKVDQLNYNRKDLTPAAEEKHAQGSVTGRFRDPIAISNADLTQTATVRPTSISSPHQQSLKNNSCHKHDVPWCHQSCESKLIASVNNNRQVGKSVQFEPSVKFNFNNEQYEDCQDNSVTRSHGVSESDESVGSHNNVLTADEVRMERRLNTLTHSNITKPDDKSKRPINIAPVSVKKYEQAIPALSSQTPLSTPLSPTIKTHVRHKPELPASFTLGRKASHKGGPDARYEPAGYSDTERTDLEKIESILSELDFSKYRRGRPTHLTVQHTLPRSFSESPRPENRHPLPSQGQPKQQHIQFQEQQPVQQPVARQVPPKLQHQHSFPTEKLAVSKSLQGKTNREKLKELTEKLKPVGIKPQADTFSDLNPSASPPLSSGLPDHHQQQQLLFQQQLQNHQLQQQLLQQQKQLQQLQQQHLEQLQQLHQQHVSSVHQAPPVCRSASLSHVDFSDEKEISWKSSLPRNVKDSLRTETHNQYYSTTPGLAAYQMQNMDSDKVLKITNPVLNIETGGQNKSDLSLDSVIDSVPDEGLVADSDASSSYMQTYRNVTSASAPSTPCLRQRMNEAVGYEVRADATPVVSKLEENPFYGNNTDKRKRRKNVNNNGNAFHTSSYEGPNKSGNGRSLTYPPQRKGSVSEGMEYTSMDSNGLKSFTTNLIGGITVPSNESSMHVSQASLADSHFSPSEVTIGETYQDVVESVTHEPSDIDKLDDRSGKTLKKKHYSDPSGEKNDGLLDLPELIASCKSEPQLGDAPTTKDSGLRLQIIEATTEPISQKGSGSMHVYPYQQSPRFGLRLSQSASVTSTSDGYCSDKDKYSQKSPQQQRRYSKKRLRGPYGEMLEEEMRKSGEKHLQKQSIAEELSFLQDLMDPKALTGVTVSSERADLTTLYGSENVDSLEGDSWGGLQLISQEGPDNSSDNDPEIAGLHKRLQDTRTHVVGELYDTERSYVESLQILVHKYYQPLKSPENAGLVESSLVEDMFFQIPEILSNHEVFLDLLRNRLETWDGKQKVGDVFVEAFTKQQVINTYTAFINNWKTAKEAIKLAVQAKPAFGKFLEHMSREHKGKLTLDALLIMPVQRIPRYELLIKELLKHTQVDHPDHRLLVLAQKEVHDLAVKINRMEREAYEAEQMQQKLKEIENLIDGLIDLVQPDRSFIRYDLVTMSGGLGTKKERCLFLFSDLLIITSIKRKSGTIRKTSSASNSPGSFHSSLDMNKYKLLMKLSLDDLDIIKSNGSSVKKAIKDMEQLEEDSALIGQITDLASSLTCSHQNLDELLKDMQITITKQLHEKHSTESQLMCLELTVTTQEGIENLSLVFSTPEIRASWESAFTEAKQKLALTADYRPPPEFLTPLPIRKTRAGLQFTCAAPTLGLNSHNLKDVWVCNSDGYVGQVCILSLQPEATVTSCNGVCNARILCITSVPAVPLPETYIQRRRAYTTNSKPSISISVEDVDSKNAKNANIQLDSESSDDDDEGIESQDEEARKKRADSLPPEEVLDVDNQHPTMWLGTEDGCVHVYNCNDNIRMKKNKVKLQHSAAVHCILHVDNKVLLSLANGDLTVYKHDRNGGWNTNDPKTVTIGSAAAPVSKMIAVTGKLWCGCQNIIKIVTIATLEIEKSFAVNSDATRSILCMAASGFGVWISVQNSATIRLFHATSFECLLDVNVASSVTKMLAGCDDIIRQHKAACLRVTALLACKDLLWVGTSAGVILNIAIPHLTSATSKLTAVPNIAGIPHGHTGHVRFLSCVEMQPGLENKNRSKYSNRSIKLKDSHALSRRSSISAMMANKMLVISGGDGYEDFRNANIGESAGRDDSTNHLLLWQV